MSSGKGKRLVYVSEALLEQAAKVCRDEDISLGRLVEVSLLQSVKINRMGYRSDQMADFFDVLQSNRVLGGLFVPSGVLDLMLDQYSGADLEKLTTLWFESGRWTGKYVSEKFTNPIEAFASFLQLSRWDLNEVDIKKDGDKVRVRCISTIMTMESTNLLGRFIEGAMAGLDYTVLSVECLKGMVILSSKKA
jgi:hypothetical protein